MATDEGISISINGRSIESVNIQKHLGITVDSR